MPTYDYKCPKCGSIREVSHGISKKPIINCFKDGTICERIFSPNTTGFIFKGGTPAIHDREKRNRRKRSEELTKKQQKYKNLGPKVKPNVAGIETGSWSDAQKLAKEAGLNAHSYTPWVEKEKKGRKIIV